MEEERGRETVAPSRWWSLTLARVGLPAAAVGRPPGTIIVERGTLLTVIPCCVVSTQTPTRHLEDTSGAAQILHLHHVTDPCCLETAIK